MKTLLKPLLKPAFPIALLCLSAVVLIALKLQLAGWLLLLLSTTVLWLQPSSIRRQLSAVAASLAVLGLTPVDASNIEPLHVAAGTIGIWIVATLPYVYLEKFNHEGVIKFSFHHGRRWYKSEVLYIVF